MKGKKLLLVLFLINPFLLFSQESYPRFFSSAGTFMTLGGANEYVYTGSTGSGLTSELNWAIPISVGAWSSFGVRFNPHWELDLRFQGAQALASGIMTDQDWNIFDSDGNAISHQESTSTSYLDSNWEVRAETAFPLELWGFTALPLVGLMYHQFYWEAWGGTLSVSYTGGATGSANWYGTSGTYRQEWFIPYLGFEMRKEERAWTWAASLRVSPYLFANNTDEHILRQLTFNDSTSGGLMIEPRLSGDWPLFPNISLTADVDYILVWGPRGDETVSFDGSSSNSQLFTSFVDSAGADFQTITVAFGLKAEF